MGEVINPEAEDMLGRIVDDDDDALFRESLERNLRDAGFEVVGLANGTSAIGHFSDAGSADLVLLDWKMPGMNGIEVLRRLRESGAEVPVIFLTVLGDQIYEEAALTGGAVDFVEKSRSFSILLKRIRLILRGGKGQKPAEAEGPQASKLQVGNLELDLESSRAAWRGERVDLTLTEFRMVHYLASRADKDVRHRELYDLVHGEGFVAGMGDDGFRANVRTFIRRIRQKFSEVDPDFRQIENYPGFGYRWRKDG